MSASRRSLQVLAFICTLVVGAAAMALLVAQTPWFKEWARRFIVGQAADYVNGRLSIGRLDGNLLFGVELEDIDVTMDGVPVVNIQDVGLDYNVFTFLTGDAVIDDIRLNRPVFRVKKGEDGWNLAQLFRARTPDAERGRRPIAVGEIGISDGTLYVEGGPVGTSGVVVPERIDRLDASIGVTSDEDALTIDIAHLSMRATGPELGVNALSGVIRRTDTGVIFENVALRTEETSIAIDGTLTTPEDGPRVLDLTASSDKFAIEEIARVIPALRGYTLQPAFEIAAHGSLDALAVEMNVREATLGRARGDLVIDAAGPERRIGGRLSLEHFNIAPIVSAHAPGSAVSSDITGDAHIDLALPARGEQLRGTYSIDADRAQVAGYEARNVRARGRFDGRTVQVDGAADAYGGHATASGTIDTRQPIALDLAGRAAGIDLRNLPPVFRVPGVPSDLHFGYTLTSRDGVYSGEARLEASTLAGAAIAPGTTVQFSAGKGAPAYAANGEVTGLDVQEVGRGFGIRAIADDRFKSRVNGTFTLSGTGGGRYPLALEIAGVLVDTAMFGAAFPHLTFETSLKGGNAAVKAAGSFSGLDPAVVSGRTQLAGEVSGSADVQTTIRDYAAGSTVDSIDVSGRVHLDRSTVAGLEIDTADIQGTYADREGRLEQLEIAGSDLTVSGEGVLALNETGSSALTAHVETPSLERIGEIIGRPLTGGAVVDATLTGNARELRAQGALQGSHIGYGDSRALSLSSTFDIAMPDLAPEAATIKANSTGTFVEVAGQSIRQLTAETTYSQHQLEFQAVAQEGLRQLAADGTVVLHPDHQEGHLASLALKSEDIEWRSVPGREVAIRYGDNRIAVDNVQLQSGDQRITANGVIGSSTEALQVQAENVDVTQIDRLLLGDQRLAGRLTADVAVRGTLQALRAEGTFSLTQGAFRQFVFGSLAGTVDYEARGFNVDVRLEQSPGAWLTATGFAPLSLFHRNLPGTTGHETPAEGDAINLQIASSQIDLGVIQGFTTYVTDVTGALQANVRVTGTGHDPHLDGVIDIRGGRFAIPDLGTAYTGLDTRIDLKPDAVTISEMRIVDEHQRVMTIGGTLAVHEREVGAVDVRVQSENFEVIDNDLADLKLDTDVRVTGELRAPRVEGFVELETGSVDVARVLEETTADPYAPEPAGTDATGATDGEAAPIGASIFDALELNLGIAVPGNLVLRGNDLRPAHAPIDIGDMNLTVGGAVQVRKAPGERPQLTGEVNTIRGSYTFQGRRFEIVRGGRIRFAGTEELDPLVDLRARRVISGVETFVRVQGTMRQPELSFSSNPPQDQADILSLIVFNMPANELGEGQQISLAERAGALAGAYLVSGLTRSIAEALEIDELELQAQGEEGLGPSLSIGEQVGERLFVRVRQGFGAAEATELILEYQIADFLRLQGAVAETSGGTQRVTFRRIERAGIDLIFFFSF